MPKSVPPEPWKLSRRGRPLDADAVVAGGGVITAVAVPTVPAGPGRVY
jgi:hypothetical protein